MFSAIKKILFFLSFFFLYFVFRELINLYNAASEINVYLGYITLLSILAFTGYFVIIPVFKILNIPIAPAPTKREQDEKELISLRLEKFAKNKFLSEQNFKINENYSHKENYDKANELLSVEADKIRKKYLTQLFYSTSISQNGFIDALIIFSTSVNLIRDIFILYNGRVSNKDLVVIAKKIYFAILISGSEGIENSTEEIFSKFANDALKSIPFIDKILASLVDGFISAALVTRACLIAENYCRLTLISSDRDLIPSYSQVIKSTKDVTLGILEEANSKLMKMSKDKTTAIFKSVINPVTILWDNTKGTNSYGKISTSVSKIKNIIFHKE